MPRVADPPARSRRERKRNRTRREIAEAALELFERDGFDATTVDRIADSADYSPSTVFRQFAGKEDILFFDFPERLDQLRAALSEHSGLSRWAVIRSAFVENAHWWEESLGDFGRRRAVLFHREPELHARYLELGDEWAEEIHSYGASRVAARAAVAAFQAAWRARVEEGGDLAGHLGAAFDELERGMG